MIDIKQGFAGGLDLDTNPLYLRPDSYVDALNVTRDATEGAQDQALTNIVGNRKVSYSFPAGTGKVIGAIANTLRNTVLFMRWNENGYHGVYEYNRTTGVIVKVFQNLTDTDDEDILTFTQNEKIDSINIYNQDEGDLLFFLDSIGQPTVMNITDMKAGTYTPVTRDILDVAKCPPLAPPACIYDNDTTRRSNNLRNKLFRFQYRWVYDDYYKSCWSPMSAVPYPASILDETFTNVVTNNNVIHVSMNSGDKSVQKIEIAVSYVNKTNEWSDYGLVVSLDKVQEGIGDDSDFQFNFYNDATYPTVDPNESVLLYDYIPRYANAQEMPNGNVLAYVGCTEGYDRDLDADVELTILTREATNGGTIGSLNAVVGTPNNFGTFWGQNATFSGVPVTGTTVIVKARRASDGATVNASGYTSVAGDTLMTILDKLDLFAISNFQIDHGAGSNSILCGAFTSNFIAFPDGNFIQIEITLPSSATDNESIPTWKPSTERTIALQYFDKKGRTNGVLYWAKVTFPAYSENGSQQAMLPYINAKINHLPPLWAYSFQWVVAKEPTTYLMWHTVDVNTAEADYIYFDVSNLAINATKTPTVASVLSYTFVEGDRLRLIRNMVDDTVYDDTYDATVEGLLTDPTINSVAKTGKWLKIKKVAPFSTVTSFADKFFVIELYRPGQSEATASGQTFYEMGEQYDILNPGTADRLHSGSVTNQTDSVPAEFNFYEGDSYFRSRTVYLSDSGQATFNVLDRNFVDFYPSAVSSLQGRPTLIDPNQREAYYPTLIRFGQAVQPNTNINGLNRFYPNDIDEYDYSFGDVERLKVRDRYMRVYQKNKVGMVPLYSQINKDASGNTVQVVTDKLLNPIQYYAGDFGIGEAGTSLVSFNFADYFFDTNRGVWCRVSNDGVQPLSILYKINSWATEHGPLRTGNYHIYGAFDPKANNCIMALEATGSDAAYTLSYSEGQNSFESFLSFHPEMMVTLGSLLISFKDGDLYTHDSEAYNTFYGSSYDSSVTMVFNKGVLQKKTFIGVTEIASEKWDCPLIYTNVDSYAGQRQESSLIEEDFEQKESQYVASFWRDQHSIGGLQNGDTLKGSFVAVKFRKTTPTDLVNLSIVDVKFIDSPLTSR